VIEALTRHRKVDSLTDRNWLRDRPVGAVRAILRVIGQSPRLLLRVNVPSLGVGRRVILEWFESLQLFPFGPTFDHNP